MEKINLRPPIKIHGGKFYLKKWILEFFPEDYEKYIYCEPFCGGASVLLNKNPSLEEVICDLDESIVHIFKALRDEPKEFISKIKRTKYTERAFKMAQNKCEKGFDDYIDHAINEYVLRRMSRGGMKQSFAWSERLRGGKPGDLNAWETMIEQLPIISERLQEVNIVNDDWKNVYKVWDEENSLTYLDPPYLHTTRSEGSTDIYDFEMSSEDHIQMLELIKNARGKIMLSGYSSPLYRRHLKDWRCKKRNVANNSSQSKTKERRIECLWLNF